MTSLPIPLRLPEPGLTAAASLLTTEGAVDDQFLLRAFSSFAEAAGSLERSYGLLRAEVTRLRRELEESNSGLARSLEETRNMRQHLDRILEGLPCGVLVVAGNGEMSRVNPEGRRLLGLRGAETENVNVEDAGAIPVQSVASLDGDLRQLLERARREAGEQEQSFSNAGGKPRCLAVRHAALPSPEAGPEPAASVFIVRDVSQRKRLEEAQDKLRRDQALAEMSTLLAHEVRNPLASLELFAGLLTEGELSPESRQWVEHVQAGLRTLAATVNNVLHFHSLPEPERAPVDLGGLLAWARDFFAPLARRAGVALSLQDRLAGVYFLADRHRLEQVLLNLVLNALRALPGGGWIEIAGHRVAGSESFVIAVSDTGPGIAPENLRQIFDPGFTTRGGSPGLGLSVCRRIVEQHRGTIAASSPPGRGATFTLTFPLAGDTAASGEKP